MRIASLVVSMAADITALQRGFSAAVGETNRMVSRIQTALGSIGLALGIREVIQYADSWTLATGRIRLYSGSASEAARIQEQLFKVAQETRQEFESTVTLYTRLTQGARQLGLGSQELLTITRAVGNALRLSNASTAESVSVMRQLSQAFSSGKFQGDELRSIIENSAVLGQVIADSLGVTVGKLRELGAEGKVVPQQVAQAILAAAAQIEKDAASLPTTIGQAFTQLSNSIQRYVGETDKGIGASRRFVAIINAVGNAFDKNRPLIESLTFAVGLAGFTGAIVALSRALNGLAFAQAIKGLLGLGAFLGPLPPLMISVRIAAAAMWSAITGPVGLAIIGITALTALFFKWRKEIAQTEAAANELASSFAKLSKVELDLNITNAVSQLFVLEDARAKLQKKFDEQVRLARPNIDTVRALEENQQQIDATVAHLGVLRKALDQVNAAASGATSGGGAGTTFDFKKFVEEGQRLLDFFDDLRDRKASTAQLADELVALFDKATAKLTALEISAPLSDEADALRKLLADIRENAAALAVIDLEKARIRLPVVPDIEVPPIAETQTSISRALQPVAALVGAQFGKAIGDMVARTLSLQSKPKLEIVTELLPPSDQDFRDLQAQIERLTSKQGLVDLAKLTDNKAFEAQTIADFQRSYDRAIVTVRNFADAIRNSNLPIAVQMALLLKLSQAAEKIPKPLQQTADRLTQFVTAGRGIVQIASQFSNLNKNILQMVGSLLDAAAAAKQFKDASKKDEKGNTDVLGQISGALGAAGAAVSFGAALGELLFGAARRAQKALEDVIKSNTAAIAENNIILKGFNDTIAAQDRLLGSLQGVLGPASRLGAARENLSRDPSFASIDAVFVAAGDLIAAVERTGFTMLELNEIAKRFNITLLDTEGRVIPEAFAQLVENINKTREALFLFQNTLSDVTLTVDLTNAANNVEDSAEQAIRDSALILSKLAPKLFERIFEGIDLSDGISSTELAEIRRRAKVIVQEFLANTTGFLNNLPGFTGENAKEEFGRFFLEFLKGLNLLDDAFGGTAAAANAVTEAMLNVPAGFRIARLRFEATAPIIPTALMPPSIPQSADPKSKGGVGTTIIQNFTVTSPINIDARDKPISVILPELRTELKRQARSISPSATASDALNS